MCRKINGVDGWLATVRDLVGEVGYLRAIEIPDVPASDGANLQKFGFRQVRISIIMRTFVNIRKYLRCTAEMCSGMKIFVGAWWKYLSPAASVMLPILCKAQLCACRLETHWSSRILFYFQAANTTNVLSWLISHVNKMYKYVGAAVEQSSHNRSRHPCLFCAFWAGYIRTTSQTNTKFTSKELGTGENEQFRKLLVNQSIIKQGKFCNFNLLVLGWQDITVNY